MKIKLRLFASVKDICGFSEKELIVSDNIKVFHIIEQLCRSHPELLESKSSLLYAVNEEYCDGEKEINENDTLAVFPPVSGG